jgi:ABC-type lipoprotein release transport system permease subunit
MVLDRRDQALQALATAVPSSPRQLFERLVVLGLAAAFALTRLLSSLLFGVSHFEPGVVFGVAAGLALAALGATYGPARRAASVDPATTLRAE